MCSMRSMLRFPLLLSIGAFALAAHAPPAGPYHGRAVQAVIDELRAAGLNVVYSSNLLSGTLRVEAEPAAADPIELAREILRPHGLALRDQAGVWLVVRGEAPPSPAPAAVVVTVTVVVPAGATVAGAIAQADAPNGP